MDKDKVSIEEAINRAGFGLYSYLGTTLAGVSIIAFACINFGTTILIPASACELETTTSQQGLLAGGPVIGTIFGTVVWGYLGDTYGRRVPLMGALLGAAVMNGVASISVNWVMLLVLQFCASLFSSGLYSLVMSLLSESVPMAKRNLVVLLVSSIFLLSQGIMAVLAIPIIPLRFSIYISSLDIYWNSWRTLMVVYSAPCIITAICVFFMQESPKFVFSKGDEQRTLEILNAIHKVNNLCSGKTLEVTGIVKEEVDEGKLTDQTTPKQNPVILLFKMPLLKYTIIMTLLWMFQQIGAFMVWLPTVANEFVRILDTGEGSNLTLCGIIQAGIDTPAVPDVDAVPCALNMTALLIVLIVGAIQSIVNFCVSLVVNFLGRRNIIMVVAALCGVAGIVVNLIPNAIGSAIMFVIMLQGMIVLGLYTAVIVALYPTQLRALAIALPLTGGRIAVFASIQILNLLLINNCNVGFYLYASLFGTSAIIASFLPDDRRLRPATTTPLEPKPEPRLPPIEENPKESYRDVSQL